MNFHATSCCGRPTSFTATVVNDAGAARRDPTGTSKLQAQFRQDMNTRWASVKRMVRENLKKRFLDPTSNVNHAALTGQDPIVAFQSWLDQALRQTVMGHNGIWTARYVREAGGIGTQRATMLTQDAGPEDEPRDKDGKWVTAGGKVVTEQYLKKTGYKPFGQNVYYHDKHGYASREKKSDTSERDISGFSDKEVSHLQTWGEIPESGYAPAYDRLRSSASFDKTIDKLPKYDGTVYRGTSLSKKELASYKVGKTIEFDKHSSAATFVSTARAYANEGNKTPVLMRITNSSFPNFGKSDYSSQVGGEVIIPMGSKIKITSIRKVGNGYVINAEHVRSKRVKDSAPLDRTPQLQSLAVAELQGICDATSQQCVRAYGTALLSRQSSGSAMQSICSVIDKIGRNRSRLLVSFFVVRAHAAATLDAFRAAGISHVGTVAERVRPTTSPPIGLTRDAIKRKAKKSSSWSSELVEVLTAGDDDVCPECQDISDEGPYTLDEAEVLIPAHPRCRCAFVPADDARFAPVRDGHTPSLTGLNDDYNPDEPRDPSGKWTSGRVALDMKDLMKVGEKKGSNDGGVYVRPGFSDEMYYIKSPPSKDHVQNELLAAKLYQLAGAKTLDYVPVKGGEHVATVVASLAKNNISQFDSFNRAQAQKDFAIHAWLANWDAAGTGGDNQGTLTNGGDTVTLDVGGALKYRAQGGTKGAAFGDKVTEIDTLRDPQKNYDAAKLFGDMTNEQITASIARVTSLTDQDIKHTVLSNGGDDEMVKKLLARRADLSFQGSKMIIGETNLTPDPTAPDPIKAHLPLVKGTPAERIAWRAEMKKTSDPAARKVLQQKVLASFLKHHDKTPSPAKKAEIAEKLSQYAKKYQMPNPLTPGLNAAKTSSQATVKPQPGLIHTPPKAVPNPLHLPSGYASWTQKEKDGFDDLTKIMNVSSGNTTQYATKYVEVAAAKLQHVEHSGMTPVEAAHIVAYSGAQYRETNAALRAGTMTKALYQHVNALDSALSKLPAYTGTVYRKADLTSDVAAKYKIGNVVTEHAFTSTSKKSGVWSGDYRFVIKATGARAHDIVKLSGHGDSEAEVLYRSGTRFLVTGRDGHKIEMEEL